MEAYFKIKEAIDHCINELTDADSTPLFSDPTPKPPEPIAWWQKPIFLVFVFLLTFTLAYLARSSGLNFESNEPVPATTPTLTYLGVSTLRFEFMQLAA